MITVNTYQCFDQVQEKSEEVYVKTIGKLLRYTDELMEINEKIDFSKTRFGYGIRIYSEENVFTKVVLDIPEKRLNEGDIYYV